MDSGRHPADGPDERVVGGTQQPAFRRCRLLCLAAGRPLATSAQIFSSAVLPTKFVISHSPSIFATSRLPAVIAATSSRVDVDEVTLEVQRAAVSVDGDLELVSGMVGQPVRRGLERPRSQPGFADLFRSRHGLSGTERPCRVRREQRHHLVDVLLGDRLVEAPLDLADCVIVGVLLESLVGSRAPARASAGQRVRKRGSRVRLP